MSSGVPPAAKGGRLGRYAASSRTLLSRPDPAARHVLFIDRTFLRKSLELVINIGGLLLLVSLVSLNQTIVRVAARVYRSETPIRASSAHFSRGTTPSCRLAEASCRAASTRLPRAFSMVARSPPKDKTPTKTLALRRPAMDEGESGIGTCSGRELNIAPVPSDDFFPPSVWRGGPSEPLQRDRDGTDPASPCCRPYGSSR